MAIDYTASSAPNGTYAALNDPYNFGIVANSDRIGAVAPFAAEANRGYFFRLDVGGTITKVRVFVSAASGNLCIALYKNAGVGLAAAPTGGRLGTTGSVVCPASGVTADLALGGSVTVAAGDWIAIAADNAVVQLYGYQAGANPSTLFAGRAGYQDAAFPLPATPAINPAMVGLAYLVGVP